MDFEEIGLSKNESKVYTTLVRLGKSSSSEISRESGVPYGVIYQVLDKLESRGLIKTIPEKSKKFVPSNPENVIEIIKEKEKKFEKMKQILKELKRDYEFKDKEKVQIARGKKNFYKIMREAVKAKKYSYNIQYNAEFNPEFVRDVDRLLKDKVDIKMLSRVDKETEENVKKWQKVCKNIKRIPNNGVAISIQDDKELIIALIKSNIILKITDESFVRMMAKLFDRYYKNQERLII
jgi:sugar-specific transcriptional regulator TrmB